MQETNPPAEMDSCILQLRKWRHKRKWTDKNMMYPISLYRQQVPALNSYQRTAIIRSCFSHGFSPLAEVMARKYFPYPSYSREVFKNYLFVNHFFLLYKFHVKGKLWVFLMEHSIARWRLKRSLKHHWCSSHIYHAGVCYIIGKALQKSRCKLSQTAKLQLPRI